MDKLKGIIKGLMINEKIKTLARTIGVSKNTIKVYRNLLEAIIQNNPAIKDNFEMILETFKSLRSEEKSTNFKWLVENKEHIKEKLSECNNLVRIHEVLIDEGFQGSYSSLSRFLSKYKKSKEDPIMRMETLPGEYAQVDFGYVGKIYDPSIGQERKAYIFVLTLCYSRHAYYEIVKNQNLESWIYCHIHAFEYIAGIPKVIIPDNLKNAIIKASFTNPKMNKTYSELAKHYGFQVDPCIPGAPEHKGKVESGVKYVKNNFMPLRRFKSFEDANEQLAEWNQQKASRRIHGTTRKRPMDLFTEFERKKLGALPACRYEIACWKELKVHKDIHVNFGYSYYSVPYEYRGVYLWCRGTKNRIQIFNANDEKVADHMRVSKGKRQTNYNHYPPDKVKYMKSTTDWCKKQAAEIGKNTLELITILLDEEPIRNLRGAQCILWLIPKYCPTRLEKACQRALYFGNYTYHGVKSILEKELDKQLLLFEEEVNPNLDDTFARDITQLLKEEEYGNSSTA
jgi:transposase